MNIRFSFHYCVEILTALFLYFLEKTDFSTHSSLSKSEKGRNFFQPAEKLVNELTKTISSVTMPVQIKEGGYTS